MPLTNKLGLPQSFVEMAKPNYEYEAGEYRVTSLLKGIRETILEQRHRNEITQDVSEMIWLLFGTAVHGVLEQQKETAYQIKESRIKISVASRILSGQFDLYDTAKKTVTDYKTTSVWKIIYKNYDEWRRQLLIYAYMLRSIGFEVEHGEIIALLKDHNKRDAKIKPDYPDIPVQKITFDFSEQDFTDIEKWIIERITALKAAESLPDNELPICTPEERYNSGDKYAVMRKNRKTALRVLEKKEDAEKYMSENGGDYIEVRPGEDKKCAEYCSVCQFCSYYQNKAAQK